MRRARSAHAFLCAFIFGAQILIILSEDTTLASTTIFEDYVECRDYEMFGNISLICDAEHKLQRSTLRSLDSLLRDLQNKIPCECTNGCDRGEGRTRNYVGLLIVTSTDKIRDGVVGSGNTSRDAATDAQAMRSLNATAKSIYEDAHLGDSECDNGLLILYIKDQQKLATYRGRGRFVLLNDIDMGRLYQLARRNHSTVKNDNNAADGGEGEGVALKYLLSTGYDEKRHAAPEGSGILHAENWAPIIGLTLALLVVLLILGILFAFLLMRLCGCCCERKMDRKHKYYVSPSPPPSTTTCGKSAAADPIYIITPPISEHGVIPSTISHHPDYSTYDYGSHLGLYGPPNGPMHHVHQHHFHPQHHHPHQRHSFYQQQHSPSSLLNQNEYSIYNSPYGPSTMSAGAPITGPIVTHTPRSRSITPTSMHGTRVNVVSPMPAERRASSHAGQVNTPQASKRDRVDRRSTLISGQNNGTATTPYYVTRPPSTIIGNAAETVHVPRERTVTAAGDADAETASTSGGSNAPELPFLDPHRRREVQTKREFIE